MDGVLRWLDDACAAREAAAARACATGYRYLPSELRAMQQQQAATGASARGLAISLAGARCGGNACVRLAHRLICDRHVTHLDCSMCDLGASGAVAFLSCLRRNRTLRHLNISGNHIGDVGAAAAADGVLAQLESLHVAANDISDAGACALARALRSDDVRTTTLNVRSNNVSAAGVYALLDALVPDAAAQLPAHARALCGAATATTHNDNGDSSTHTTCNTTLHTLWVGDNAADMPQELLDALARVLASRTPAVANGTAAAVRTTGKRARRVAPGN